MNNWLDLVKQSNSIALFAHINSDGDANGSVMAMASYLKSLDKQVFVFIPTPINQSYWFLGGNKVSCKKRNKHYDLAIGLDCPNTKRFGQCEQEFFKADKTINIDHHADNEMFADVNIVDTDESSACELLYGLFKKANIKISKPMATALYTGIATDTGGFTHGSHGDISAQTFSALADLTNCGAELSIVNYNLFTHMRKPVFELLKTGLDVLEFYADGKIAVVAITRKMLDNAGADISDTHRIKDIIGGIDGVEISVIMAENKPCENYISVRSKTHSAQRICKHFGGGGHIRASGCRLYIPLEDAKKQLVAECLKELGRKWKVEL